MAASSYLDLGPGLHVLRESDPMKRAGAMAASMRAELCATLAQADELLVRRSELPALDPGVIAEMQVLARRVARAQRIADRTRDRAVEDIAGRLAGGMGLAVHPETIRERAAALDRARAALSEVEARLAEHANEVTPQDVEWEPAPAADVDAAGDDEPHARTGPSPADRRRNAMGALAVAFGVTFLLLGLAGAPLWVALLPPLAASLWASRHLRLDETERTDQGERAASSLLAAMSASTDQVFGAIRASKELDSRGALLTARQSRAEEDVRVAARAWHELAGAEMDTDELDAVVRRFDPQHEDAQLVAGESVGVRALDGVLRQFQERWVERWRELGLAAPDPAESEAAIDELARSAARPIVLVGPATARGPELARAAPAAPVVVLDGPLEAIPEGQPDGDSGAAS